MILLLACLIVFGGAASARAQESRLHADVRREAGDVRASCGNGFEAKDVANCVYTLTTDDPLHVALGTIAPQNGVAFGLAFVEHWTPSERWRIGWNADAVGSPNGSYRAGFYMKLIATPSATGGGIVVRRPGEPAATSRPSVAIREYPVFNIYAQTISLDTLPITAGNDRFRERQTIVGTNVVYPVTLQRIQPLRLSIVGAVNGRFVATRSDSATLNQSASFAQFEEGFRFRPSILDDHLRLNYFAGFQQFETSHGTAGSFHRWTVDFAHDVPLYRTVSSTGPKETNGPNECAQSIGGRCPPLSFSRNREGSIAFRVLVSRSIAGDGNSVPFYFQPTLGGSDLNGRRLLSAFDDYQFRGTNLFALQERIEHSIWGPFGVYVLAEQGSLTPEGADLTAENLARSFGVGLTIRAGGFPLVNLTFAWGGGSHHIIGTIDSTLLGGSSRPSLY
jgi:hypothetical protein